MSERLVSTMCVGGLRVKSGKPAPFRRVGGCPARQRLMFLDEIHRRDSVSVLNTHDVLIVWSATRHRA